MILRLLVVLTWQKSNSTRNSIISQRTLFRGGSKLPLNCNWTAPSLSARVVLLPTTQAQLGLWKGDFALRPAFFRGARNKIGLSARQMLLACRLGAATAGPAGNSRNATVVAATAAKRRQHSNARTATHPPKWQAERCGATFA